LEAVVKSRASLKAHPLHPALIPFPFAFLTGSALFDLGFFATGAEALTRTAAHLSLAGLAAGLLAAVPGIIDYVYTVPPGSSAKARATRHGAGNVIALVLFGIAFGSRDGEWIATFLTLGLQVAGAAVLAYSGWLGGTLVTRNLISVDHRYADKGRWQEATFTGRPGEEIAVAKTSDLKDGHMKLLHINGRRIALARTPSGFHAVDDGCTHRGGSLAGGVLIGDTVQCLWHGSQFDVRTGKALCGPAETGVETMAVRVDKGQVLVRMPK
jgi:nitrite reductase/ring-hydroxylating ferredoxin subunit/uncharacterized membrane protein